MTYVDMVYRIIRLSGGPHISYGWRLFGMAIGGVKYLPAQTQGVMSLPTEPTADDVAQWLNTPAVTQHGFDREDFIDAAERGEDYTMSLAFDPERGDSAVTRHDFFKSDAVEVRSVCVNRIWEEHGGVFVAITIKSPSQKDTFIEYLRENIFNGGKLVFEESGRGVVNVHSPYIASGEIGCAMNDDRAAMLRVYGGKYDGSAVVTMKLRDTEQ